MESERWPLDGEWKGSPGKQGSPLMSGNRMKNMKISENYVEMNVMFWYSIVVGEMEVEYFGNYFWGNSFFKV